MRHKILESTDDKVHCQGCGWVKKTIKDGRPKCSVARRQHRGRPGMSLHQRCRGSECEVCGATEDLVTDHNHECCPGKYGCVDCIRGTLCRSCNTSEGYVARLVRDGLLGPMLRYMGV